MQQNQTPTQVAAHVLAGLESLLADEQPDWVLVQGDIIVRVDARTILEPDYVRRCVEALQRTGAGNVGGLQRPIGQNYLGQAIALTLRSPLAVGDSKFHYNLLDLPTAVPYNLSALWLHLYPRNVSRLSRPSEHYETEVALVMWAP